MATSATEPAAPTPATPPPTARYPQHRSLDQPAIEREILAFWEREGIFQRSVDNREGAPSFTFYEGPPSANGQPGIHHVMARAIKDLFCRYHTLAGKQVKRKAGWDTHGLPIELQVEKELGITKADIGKTISVEAYNQKCRETVMRYKERWDELTRRMGYWVDLEHPYITFENDYIESVWHLLKTLYDQDLLYKGYTIQPYSPAAGTGLSSHELNMPGAYREVKDLSAVAMFRADLRDARTRDFLGGEETYFLAWTTTPWTLPANTALVVGDGIDYVLAQSYNPFSGQPVRLIYAAALQEQLYHKDILERIQKAVPGAEAVQVARTVKGRELVGLRYEQLMPWVQPDLTGGLDAFRVISGDFVTTEDGTGIVHAAPTFGADDMRAAQKNGIAALTVQDEAGVPSPIVDKQGKYVAQLPAPFGGRFIKDYPGQGLPYLRHDPALKRDLTLDEDILEWLRKHGQLFKREKYEHNYPHCWRTDKPVLYYPLDAWFIRTSRPDIKQRLLDLNDTINWKPAATGTGRFRGWLENLVDWNLSRSRYWGIPLPVWRNAEGTETKCIGSVAELHAEVDRARAAGIDNPDVATLDLHKPFVDRIVLADSQGRPMHREPDLIDVWFDSGAMPYAQWHYPFEGQGEFANAFPADFIAEGVDQTRGWFFTLHAIAAMTHNSVAFKNVVSNGLVLDKNGNKMSKRLGNAVDPFDTLATYGADATRWYMVENAPPWENLKFNLDNLQEGQRKFFGTLFNTYQFFALYANIDDWKLAQFDRVPREQLPELDRWIWSRLYSLVREVRNAYEDYDPTRAARAIQDFTIEELSNWYVRLSRRRFWKGELTTDKRAAYETLQASLCIVAQLMAPIAPFFADWLYRNITEDTRAESVARKTPFQHPSIHLSDLVEVDERWIDPDLEARMDAAQRISSLGHGIRKKLKLRTRQPLAKLLVAVRNADEARWVAAVSELIRAEINVKDVEVLPPDSDVIHKTIKANFKTLGPRLGARMKDAAQAIAELGPAAIQQLEGGATLELTLGGEAVTLTLADVDIRTEDIPGWSVASDGRWTVALDVTLTEDLRQEGLARELVNRIQNLRKEQGFAVTDPIRIAYTPQTAWADTIRRFDAYICSETLAVVLQADPTLSDGQEVDIDGLTARFRLDPA